MEEKKAPYPRITLCYVVRCLRTIAPDELVISKGKELGELREVKEEFRVSFDLNLKSIQPYPANILHFKSMGSRNGEGDKQIPAVFTVAGKDMFKICSDNKNSLNRCFTSRWGYFLDRWINVKIIQSKYGQRYLIKLLFNGEELRSLENTSPRRLSLIKIYAGSPDYNPAAGSIRNLQIDGMIFWNAAFIDITQVYVGFL